MEVTKRDVGITSREIQAQAEVIRGLKGSLYFSKLDETYLGKFSIEL